MKTIETIATVTADGKITVQLPVDISSGEYRVVVLIDEKPLLEIEEKQLPLKFSAYPVGLVSEITFRREDLYAND